MTRRNGPYWLDRARRECAAGDRLRMRVAVLAHLACIAAQIGTELEPIDFGRWPPLTQDHDHAPGTYRD